MIESGYPDFVFATDAMILAPAKTPPGKRQVARDRNAQSPQFSKEMKDRMFQNGFLVRANDGKACWARLTKEMDTFRQIIDQAGIKKL